MQSRLSRRSRRRASQGPEPLRGALLLGGTSEIGLAILRAVPFAPGAVITLAGRDRGGLAAAADAVQQRHPAVRVRVDATFEATDREVYRPILRAAFAASPVDLVIPAFGVLGDQARAEQDPAEVWGLLTVNTTGQVLAMLEAARLLRAQGGGTIVVLSSIAAVRPRRANYVYGASKAGLDAAARGLATALHGSGVRVLLVRPGFVIGRMTRGMPPAPLSTRPDAIGAAVAAGLRRGGRLVWVPPAMRLVAGAFRLLPPAVWRRLPR